RRRQLPDRNRPVHGGREETQEQSWIAYRSARHVKRRRRSAHDIGTDEGNASDQRGLQRRCRQRSQHIVGAESESEARKATRELASYPVSRRAGTVTSPRWRLRAGSAPAAARTSVWLPAYSGLRR